MGKTAARIQDLKKNHFYLQTDQYLDEAIKNALGATKSGFENRPYIEALQYKVLCINEAEAIALAMEVIKKGKYTPKDSSEEKTYVYQRGLDAFNKSVSEPSSDNKEEHLNWQIRLANFKLQLIISALHKNTTSTVEFTF